MNNYDWNLIKKNDFDWNIPYGCIFDYLQVCEESSKNDEKFNNFKQNSQYKAILEHISKEESDLFIGEMKNLNSVSGGEISLFKENDVYGNPEIYSYALFGQISPSTIRYIKNTLDIQNYFGDDIKDIVEIGGGYGGLCKTMQVRYDFKNYVLIDLPQVNMLSKKYISKFSSLSGKVSQFSPDEITNIKNIDLVISNYAFSECDVKIQEFYYNTVISNAKYFYMVYNNITPYNMNWEKFKTYASKDFNIHIEEEIRSTHTNYIFYGTKK
jgi:putative sugar O-methyltransferase